MICIFLSVSISVIQIEDGMLWNGMSLYPPLPTPRQFYRSTFNPVSFLLDLPLLAEILPILEVGYFQFAKLGARHYVCFLRHDILIFALHFLFIWDKNGS